LLREDVDTNQYGKIQSIFRRYRGFLLRLSRLHTSVPDPDNKSYD
jgi:hypothetical protein